VIDAENEAAVDFSSLLGEHVLSGVDMAVEQRKTYGDSYEDANACRFVLDGVAYTALEDPSDGYRSCLDKVFVGGSVANTFSPIKVVGTMRPAGSYHANDVLTFIDSATGLIVLEVGTEDSDDYYPGFVAAFHPENMASNRYQG